MSLISVVSCSAEETPSAPPISDITIDNFPIIDGSDSTDPLRTILMCKILGFNYKWERRPFTQEPGADIKMIVPEYTCSEDERIYLSTHCLKQSNTHMSFMNLIDDKVEMVIAARLISRDEKVYAEENGSAAAPTAGLHFTKELLEEIKAKGVHLVYLTLHVGLGTFRPVSVDNIEEHHMHSEFYRLTEEAAKQLNEVRQAGGRIVAVGTTSIRTLETIGTKFNGEIQADSGWTDIFITPGYQFKVVEAFSTNFHLPKSTLVMLVSAFAGKDLTLAAYQHAIEEKYRFFSFGDAMFIK